jgi:hypothetical protein
MSRTPDDDPTSFSYTPFGMISKKHGVKFYSDQSIPIEQYELGVSDIVNSDHIIAASRMRSDVVIFVSSLEDVLKAGDIVVYENAIILFLKRYIEKCRDLILR